MGSLVTNRPLPTEGRRGKIIEYASEPWDDIPAGTPAPIAICVYDLQTDQTTSWAWHLEAERQRIAGPDILAHRETLERLVLERFIQYVEKGYCAGVAKKEIAEHGYVLTPGRYVGAADVEEDDEPFEEKMARLTTELEEQFTESARLEQAIRANLKRLGLGRQG